MLLPKQGAYGIWPASGEIDIMESRGNSVSARTLAMGTGVSIVIVNSSEAHTVRQWSS